MRQELAQLAGGAHALAIQILGNVDAAALATLPGDKREVIVLRDYLDLSYAEIAGVLGVAQGTVMSRIHRARLALKEALGSYDE